MSKGSELKSPGAKALRAAGFKPLPRWWVKDADLELIEYMARQHEEEVNAIRARANELERAWASRDTAVSGRPAPEAREDRRA